MVLTSRRHIVLFLENFPAFKGLIFNISAKEDRDFIEIFCGESMRRHLGYPDSESRTIDDKNSNDKNTEVDGLTPGAAANSTQADTPNVMSDMSKLCFNFQSALMALKFGKTVV